MFLMLIFNTMLGTGLGGIEQAFVDYTIALQFYGNDVISIIHPKSKIKAILDERNLPYITVDNLGMYDYICVLKLRRLLKKYKPDYVITHGVRPMSLFGKAGARIAAVAHNYSIKRLMGASLVLTITKDLHDKFIAAGRSPDNTFIVPNMIEGDPMPTRDFRDPVMIGTMGRFVKKKGFDDYITALRILKDRGYNFRARLGGDGEESSSLREMAKSLDGWLEFSGWVKNKREFFSEIDIFCLSSKQEAFGIVLLEAFVTATPVVSTNCEGPIEVVTDGYDAIFAEKNNPKDLANKLEILIKDPKKARQLAENGIETVSKYNIFNIGAKVDTILKSKLLN